jgi:hypothetical protein
MRFLSVLLCGTSFALFHKSGVHVQALNGDTLQFEMFNGWKGIEIITEGDDPSGDGHDWSIPRDFDGAGAWMKDPNTLQILVNHETMGDATISEVDIHVPNLNMAILRMRAQGDTSGITFVESARQAFGRYSNDLGESFKTTTRPGDIEFNKFCSGQTYAPNTFGSNRGFVDQMYITGEEDDGGGLFVLDNINRELYLLSGVTGSDPNGGNGGMPFDPWENAALVDTGEEAHVALLLSPDGGSKSMQFYIGRKGLDKLCRLPCMGANCMEPRAPNFLERNGLACGSWYYLTGNFPGNVGGTELGDFSKDDNNALSSGKLEDVDTSPSDPTRVVLADETSGTFVFDFFDLVFFNGNFNSAASSFTVTMIADQCNDCENTLGDADNVDWTAATQLGGVSYPDGLIFVNEDTAIGEVWQINPDGSNPVRVAKTKGGRSSSGIIDVSEFLGYNPGSLLICNTLGNPASTALLINPKAQASVPSRPTIWRCFAPKWRHLCT